MRIDIIKTGESRNPGSGNFKQHIISTFHFQISSFSTERNDLMS